MLGASTAGRDGLGVDVAHQRDLALDALGDVAVGAQHEPVGLDADLAQRGDGVLGRLGLELAAGREVGHQRDVQEEDVVAAHVVAHLAGGLEERQRLDVADGAADLGDDHVRGVGPARGAAGRLGPHALLDLVGDVRDHLDGVAEVLPAPLLGDDLVVDLPGRHVRRADEVAVEEALVVADVEVGLGAVLGHEDLAVLERVHRARIDVEIRIELLHRDAQTASPEQVSEAGGGQTLAERRGNASGYEDVFRLSTTGFKPTSSGRPSPPRLTARLGRLFVDLQGGSDRIGVGGQGCGTPRGPGPAAASSRPGPWPGTVCRGEPLRVPGRDQDPRAAENGRLPPTSVATTAAPACSASWRLMGCPSQTALETTRSAAAQSAGTSLRWPRSRTGRCSVSMRRRARPLGAVACHEDLERNIAHAAQRVQQQGQALLGSEPGHDERQGVRLGDAELGAHRRGSTGRGGWRRPRDHREPGAASARASIRSTRSWETPSTTVARRATTRSSPAYSRPVSRPAGRGVVQGDDHRYVRARSRPARPGRPPAGRGRAPGRRGAGARPWWPRLAGRAAGVGGR